MITLRSIACAVLAGLCLGYGLDAFINQGHIGDGIYRIVLFIIATVLAIVNIRRPVRYVEVHEEEDQ